MILRPCFLYKILVFLTPPALCGGPGFSSMCALLHFKFLSSPHWRRWPTDWVLLTLPLTCTFSSFRCGWAWAPWSKLIDHGNISHRQCLKIPSTKPYNIIPVLACSPLFCRTDPLPSHPLLPFRLGEPFPSTPGNTSLMNVPSIQKLLSVTNWHRK